MTGNTAVNARRVCAIPAKTAAAKCKYIFLSRKNKKQSRLGRSRFPALGASYVYLLWVFIGSLRCVRLLWLAIVIALVFDIRHSIKNHSVYEILYFEAKIKAFPEKFNCFVRRIDKPLLLGFFWVSRKYTSNRRKCFFKSCGCIHSNSREGSRIFW